MLFEIEEAEKQGRSILMVARKSLFCLSDRRRCSIQPVVFGLVMELHGVNMVVFPLFIGVELMDIEPKPS